MSAATTARARRKQVLRADMPVSLTEVGFVLSIMFLATFLMALSFSNEGAEKNLPDIDLARMEDSGRSGQTENRSTALSIQKKKGGIGFYIDETEIPKEKLAKALKDKEVAEVSIRADKDVSHGTVMELVGLCKKSGVASFSFVFKTK